MPVDLTRKYGYNEKKTISVAAATMKAADILDATAHDLFNLPNNALITNAWLICEEYGQTNLTLSVGIKGVSATSLFNAIDVDGTPANKVSDAKTAFGGTGTTPNIASSVKGPNILTGTGATVILTASVKPTAGRFVVVVEYVEYDLGNGNLMSISA